MFLRAAIDGTDIDLTWDLGCNDGIYSRIVAEQGAYVVAVDSDDVTVDVALPLAARGRRHQHPPAGDEPRRPVTGAGLAGRGAARVHRPRRSPISSWRSRSSTTSRSRRTCRSAEVVSWFRRFGGRLIVEFVEPHDPMAKRLLGNKPAGMFPDYRIDEFERLLDAQFTIERKEALPSGSRTLFACTPRERGPSGQSSGR